MFFAPKSKVPLTSSFVLSSTATASGTLTLNTNGLTLYLNGTSVPTKVVDFVSGDVVEIKGTASTVYEEERYIEYTLSNSGALNGKHYTLVVNEAPSGQSLLPAMVGKYWHDLVNEDTSAITDNRIFRYDGNATQLGTPSGATPTMDDTIVLADYPRNRILRYKPDGSPQSAVTIPDTPLALCNVINGDYYDVWVLTATGRVFCVDRNNVVSEKPYADTTAVSITADSKNVYLLGAQLTVIVVATGVATKSALPSGVVGAACSDTDLYVHTATTVYKRYQDQWREVLTSTFVGSIAVWGGYAYAALPAEKCVARIESNQIVRLSTTYLPMYLSVSRSGMCATTLDTTTVLRVSTREITPVDVGYRVRFATLYGASIFMSEYGQHAQPYTYWVDQYADEFTLTGNAGVVGLGGSSMAVLSGMTDAAKASVAPLFNAKVYVDTAASNKVNDGQLVWVQWQADRPTRLPFHIAGVVGLLDVSAQATTYNATRVSADPVFVPATDTIARISLDIQLPSAMPVSKQFGTLTVNGQPSQTVQNGILELMVQMPLGIDRLQPVLTIGTQQFQLDFIRVPRSAITLDLVDNAPVNTVVKFGSFTATEAGIYTIAELSDAYLTVNGVVSKPAVVKVGDVVSLFARTSPVYRDLRNINVVGPSMFYSTLVENEPQLVPNFVTLGQLVEPELNVFYDSISFTISGLETGVSTPIRATRGAKLMMGGVEYDEVVVSNGDSLLVRYANSTFYMHNVDVEAEQPSRGWVKFGSWQVLPVQLNGSQVWTDIDYLMGLSQAEYETWRYPQADTELLATPRIVETVAYAVLPSGDLEIQVEYAVDCPTGEQSQASQASEIDCAPPEWEADALPYEVLKPIAEYEVSSDVGYVDRPVADYEVATEPHVAESIDWERVASPTGVAYTPDFSQLCVGEGWAVPASVLLPTVYHDAAEAAFEVIFETPPQPKGWAYQPNFYVEHDGPERGYYPNFTAIVSNNGMHLFERFPVALEPSPGLQGWAPSAEYLPDNAVNAPFYRSAAVDVGSDFAGFTPSWDKATCSELSVDSCAVIADPSAGYLVDCQSGFADTGSIQVCVSMLYGADVELVFDQDDQVPYGAFPTPEAALQYANDVGFNKEGTAYTYRLSNGYYSYRKTLTQVLWCTAQPSGVRPAYWYMGGG